MKQLTTRKQGQRTEQLAQHYLQQQGLKFISQNYHCRYGEIDLIMQDGKILVFIEVRFRKSDRFGGALESVNDHKQQRIILTAQQYLQRHRISSPCRFDVVAIWTDDRNQFRFDWVKNAFQC